MSAKWGSSVTWLVNWNYFKINSPKWQKIMKKSLFFQNNSFHAWVTKKFNSVLKSQLKSPSVRLSKFWTQWPHCWEPAFLESPGLRRASKVLACRERGRREQAHTDNGATYTPTADLTTAKLLFNSVISDPGSRFFELDVSNFYLQTKFTTKDQYEYMYIPTWAILKDIMDQYNLHDKIHNGWVLVEVRTGIYRLTWAGQLAYLKLVKHLAVDGYVLTGYMPGLFRRITRPVLFNLVVDEFRVKYKGKQHAQHLIDTLKKHYEITVDWEGKLFCSIHLSWDYDKHTIELSMPSNVDKALQWFHKHSKTSKPEHSPHKWNRPRFGSHQHLTNKPDLNPKLTPEQQKLCQEIVSTFLYYAQAVDNTFLTPVGAIATAMSSASWKDIEQRLDQLL